jgi:hypothetical protein
MECILVLMSCVMAMGVNLSSMGLIGKTSAVTYQVWYGVWCGMVLHVVPITSHLSLPPPLASTFHHSPVLLLSTHPPPRVTPLQSHAFVHCVRLVFFCVYAFVFYVLLKPV